MLAIEQMVLPAEPLADIGTDHGWIPADLLMRGVCPFAVMTDVNDGPLEKCRANMAELGLDPSLYDIRSGSGFQPLKPGEVSTVIIAGMGGKLMRSMFDEAPYSPSAFRRMILQPRTHSDELRAYLTGSGYHITDYSLAKERGRICEIFAVEPCCAGEFSPDNALISESLLKKDDPLLKEFIDRKIISVNNIISARKKANTKTDTDILADKLLQLREIRRNV